MQLTTFDVAAGTLAIRESPGTEPGLVCLHGFTLHGGMFGPLAAQTGRRLRAPDLPGHGGTHLAPIDLATTLAALATWLQRDAGPQVVLGYSQGGRIALHFAARHPELVRHVIAVSASVGILDPTERNQRRRADERLASHINNVGITAFLDEWSRHPLVGTTHLDPAAAAADRRLRAENTAERLAAALLGLGQGVVPPAPTPRPVTWVAGERDLRYRELAEDAAAQLGTTAAIVEGAGHNLVLEAPDALAGVVDEVFSRLP